MAEKSSNLNLYASDDLDVLALKVECASASVNVEAVTSFVVDSQKISFIGNLDPTKDIDDVATYFVERESDRAAKFAEQDGKNDTNAANIAAETSTRESTFNSQQALIQAEVARASAAEAGVQTNIDAEVSARLAQYNSIDAAITQEASDRAAAVSAATTQATVDINAAKDQVTAGDDALNARLDALLAGSGVDYDTLKEITDAYQLKDTEIAATIATLRADFDALKLKYDTAFPETADPNP